eukprot:scaffold3437_cov113-Cylindrotheca_fusiformis.AAC.39
MTTTSSVQAISFPMDLESSLGRIEDSNMNDLQESLDENEKKPRTSQTYPFNNQGMNVDSIETSPYPLKETESERQERESLTKSNCQFDLLLDNGITDADMGSISDDDEWGLDPSEDSDDKSFHLLEEEAMIMTKSGLELEKIGDPISFWQG